MDHYIFYKTLNFENKLKKVHVLTNYETETIRELKETSKTDIYVCGVGIC